MRVVTGPFADLVGELIRLDGTRRARVLLQLLDGAVAASIDRGGFGSGTSALDSARRRYLRCHVGWV